ncbi:O-antigen ligase family protein [Patescibacteria group bacterium]|nr:O-antigen ligase family protein [Patescibacteria group bacterium]
MNSEFAKGQLLQMADWSRISSTFAGHYDLATYLSVSLVIILAVSIRLKNKFFKFLGLICFLLAFHNLVLTASRVSVFAFWGAVTITLLLIKKYFWVIPVSLLVLLSLFTSKELNQRLIATLYTAFPTKTPTAAPTLPAPTLAPVAVPVVKTPVKKIAPLPTPLPTVTRHQIEEEIPVDADSGVARSGEIRFNAEWPRAITAYKKNPLFGTGLGSITLATDNDYLRLLGESGLLGFITLTSILLFFFIHTFFPKKSKNNKSQQLNFIFFGALLSFLANAVFIDVFEASKTAYMFWIMMALYYQNIKHD